MGDTNKKSGSIVAIDPLSKTNKRWLDNYQPSRACFAFIVTLSPALGSAMPQVMVTLAPSALSRVQAAFAATNRAIFLGGFLCKTGLSKTKSVASFTAGRCKKYRQKCQQQISRPLNSKAGHSTDWISRSKRLRGTIPGYFLTTWPSLFTRKEVGMVAMPPKFLRVS